MNGSTTVPLSKAAIACLIAAAPLLATAQSTIQMANKPYVTQPDIGFLIAPNTNTTPVTTPVTPIASVTPTIIAPTLLVMPSFELRKGKSIEPQLVEFGKQSGWDLVWEAPEYVVDRNMKIEGNFENAVLSFLNGANEAGTRLRAVFYRGNKTVRITEF